MKSTLCFCGLIAMTAAVSLGDRGRGSIREAARPAPAAPQRPPEHVEPAHGPPDVRHDEHAPPEVRRDVHVEVQVHRDWDDNDEDARHWGGFAHGASVHIDRGQRFHDLPPSNVRILFNRLTYFLDDTGAYYQQQPDGQYLVIQPPIGVVVTALPAGVVAIPVGPTVYNYLDGVYYVAQGNGFAVVNPPPGIIVPSLPTGAGQAVINGSVVYQFEGFNYHPAIQDGVTMYSVTPG